MGIFNLFKPPKTEEEQVLDDLMARLFPGGLQEKLFKAKKVVDISNGKLDLAQSAKLYATAKARIWLASTRFDGERQLGVTAEALLKQANEDAQGKLSLFERAGIIYYCVFDKVNPALDSHIKIKEWANMVFGTDERGTDADVISNGLGEFGYDATNPVPVRGIFSNKIYLDRLRTKDGRKVEYKRTGSQVLPTVDGNIDDYNIIQDGKAICKLHIAPYNRKISARPPAGFILVKQD